MLQFSTNPLSFLSNFVLNEGHPNTTANFTLLNVKNINFYNNLRKVIQPKNNANHVFGADMKR